MRLNLKKKKKDSSHARSTCDEASLYISLYIFLSKPLKKKKPHHTCEVKRIQKISYGFKKVKNTSNLIR